jgi:hypothetical protein
MVKYLRGVDFSHIKMRTKQSMIEPDIVLTRGNSPSGLLGRINTFGLKRPGRALWVIAIGDRNLSGTNYRAPMDGLSVSRIAMARSAAHTDSL